MKSFKAKNLFKKRLYAKPLINSTSYVNNNVSQNLPSTTSSPDISLEEIFAAGYGSEKQHDELFAKGYRKDSDLSSGNQQVWYNPETKKLIYNVTGTHNKKDIKTDILLAFGKVKKTKRYKEAKNVLRQARDKYADSQVIITGHSLGGTIGSYLTSKAKRDEFYGYNAGYTVGQKTRSYGGKQHHYRTKGDIVSLLGAGAKNMTTLQNPNKSKYDFLAAHNTENLQKNPIYIA
jgi:hypothetical protein